MSLTTHEIVLMVLGLAAFGVVGLPHVLRRRPLSYPIIFVVGGAFLFGLPLDLVRPDPVQFSQATEVVTEIGVITALMGAGLAINRVPSWKAWNVTVRLLAITMPLTILAVGLLGWWALGLTPAAAILLGAILAPTDPVLASDVQVPGPNGDDDDDDEVRFALTSEAGLNDGLAFPFTNLAVLVAARGLSPAGWAVDFLLVEVAYKIAVGLLAGWLVGRFLAWAIFARQSPIPRVRDGLVAIAATFVSYAVTEMVGGYGFLAVFVAAVVMRNQEREHEYLEVMHQFSDQIERFLSAVILIVFGGALVSGVLATLDWKAGVLAAVIVLVIRPVAGLIGLVGCTVPRRERGAIAFFGIRGVGSFYYLAYATNEVEFIQVDQVWAVTAMVVAISVFVHGVTATPIMRFIDGRT